MAKHTQTRDQLEQHLEEQLAFLSASASAFDAGYFGEAKRMAVTARVLLHSTAVSHSLLAQLGTRHRPFFDTAYPNDPLNLLAHHGLVGFQFEKDSVRYRAPLGDRLERSRWTPFADWWERDIVIDDRKGGTLTRRGLVLALSNKDGGAHVDPELDETYANLKFNNSMGWLKGKSGGVIVGPLLDVELHSMRQVAHEIAHTLAQH